MPNLDGKGPQGYGPKSGIGTGTCNAPQNRIFPQSNRQENRGGCRRRSLRCNRIQTSIIQKDALAEYKKNLEKKLEEVQKFESNLTKNE